MSRLAGVASLAAMSLSCVAGCTAWRGDLDADTARRIETRLREIESTSLQARSLTPPITVEDDLQREVSARETQAASAPAARSMSIAELRLATLANNLDLDVEFVSPEIARTRVSEEEAKFDAVLFGGARYRRQDLPELDGDLVSLKSDDEELDGAVVKLTEVEQQKEKLAMDFGIKVPLPTGGVASLSQILDEQNTLEPKRFEQYVSALKFSFSQPLLRGAGVDANVASIRLARLAAGVVDARTKLAAIRVLAAAEKAYWRVDAARRTLEVRQQQFDLASRNLALVRRRVDEGLSPEIEVIRAEVGVASRLEALIIAQTDYRLEQRDLKRMLNIEGLGVEASTQIEPTSDPELLRYELDADELVSDALANRLELFEIELELAADAIRIDLAENQALPLFVLDFEYGVLDRRGSFGGAWQGMWDFDKSEFAVGVRGEIPVTNEARRSVLRRTILSRLQRFATQRQREVAVRQEVYDALDVLQRDWRRILAARQNVVVSGINYEAELRQFEEGLRTMREVLEALAQLGDAQVREVNAILAYQVAQIDLAYATGTLLGYARVGLAPLPLDRTRE